MLARNATPGGEIDFFGWSLGAPPGDYWNSAAWHWSDTAALYTKEYGKPKVYNLVLQMMSFALK